MKLSKIAPIVLNIIKTNRSVNAKDIARISGIALRRVYDITTVLEALDLIDIEKPRGWEKEFVWRGTKAIGKKVKFNSSKIKIFCVNGTITRIQNNPIVVIIEGSHNLTVENYVEFFKQ